VCTRPCWPPVAARRGLAVASTVVLQPTQVNRSGEVEPAGPAGAADVTIRDGRVGAEGREGREFAVVAGDGTVQLPPAMLDLYPPGTLFSVEEEDGTLNFRPDS
jgi:hypothetical protein